MCPGLIDSHMHLLLLSNKLRRTDIGVAKTFRECMDIMAKAAEEKKGTNGWAMGIGFNQDDWTDCNEVPTRLDLDKACGDVPAYIERACGHIATLNTKAMELMGMMNEKEGESQYKLRYFEDGTPNGVLCEDTVRLVEEYFPIPTVPEMKELILMGARYIAAKGLVGVHSDDLNLVVPVKDMPVILQAYKELSEADELPIRVHQQCRMLNLPMIEKFCSEYKVRTKWGKNFTIGDIKIMGDGSLGSRTAHLSVPYMGGNGSRGYSLFSEEHMNSMVSYAHAHGMQVAIHAIGDACLDQVLHAIELALREHPRADHRHGVVHCQVSRRDQLERIRALHLHVYAQSIFLDYDNHIVNRLLPPALAQSSYSWKTLLESGVSVSNGSDCPVELPDVMEGIECAVTRQSLDGTGPYLPDEAFSVREALDSYTIRGAEASFDENRKGRICEGYLADFVILGRDPFRCEPRQIHNIPVLASYLNGVCVYRMPDKGQQHR